MKKAGFLLVLVVAFSFRPAAYEVGDVVSDFKLKNVDGKMVSMADYSSAKGFIVIFDCNTCPFSKGYNERIVALHNKYADKGFPVIAINPNAAEISKGDSYEEMVKRARQKNYPYAYLHDETQAVAKAFGASNTPHVFVVAKSGGSLKVAYIGTIDDNARDGAGAQKKYVENAVDELLAGKAVTQPKTKAIGCGIKWRDA
jgi:glutathione peroxidase-family protein